MQQISIIVTAPPEDGMRPYAHGEIAVAFHHAVRAEDLPVLDGSIWAFINFDGANFDGECEQALELCRRLRCNPVTANARITAFIPEGELETRRKAQRAGANDFITARPSRKAMLDRVLSLQGRSLIEPLRQTITIGDLGVDLAAFQARWQGKPIRLMPNEFRLLRYFAEHPSRVFTRQQLITALGKQEPPIDERTVDVWIGRLRRALRAAGVPYELRTVRSLGYVFDEP